MTPELRHVCDIDVSVDAIRDLGPMPHGRRRIIPILSGTVKGERLQGEVMPGGTDWQYVRSDGVLELEARYSIKASDGAGRHTEPPAARRAGRSRPRLLPHGPRVRGARRPAPMAQRKHVRRHGRAFP